MYTGYPVRLVPLRYRFKGREYCVKASVRAGRESRTAVVNFGNERQRSSSVFVPSNFANIAPMCYLEVRHFPSLTLISSVEVARGEDDAFYTR